MRTTVLSLSLVFACLCCSMGAGLHTTPSYPMREVTIDLDVAPEHRWDAAVAATRPAIESVLKYLLSLVGPGAPFHGLAEDLREAALEGKTWDTELLQEMAGVAREMNTTVDSIQLCNLFFEFGPQACTGIVAQMGNGSVIHARNLDLPTPGLPEITVWAKFVRGGKMVYQGTTFVGYVGLPTAMLSGAFSIEVNTRLIQGWSIDLPDNARSARLGGLTVGGFIRKAVEQVTSYEGLLEFVRNERLIAPCYFTICGVSEGEGAVVTRDRVGVADKESHGEGIWSLGTGNATSSWYRVETNFDHWRKIQDGRRTAANKAMMTIGQQNISMDGLYSVLSTPPVLQKTTIYTAKMFPAAGTYWAAMRKLS